MKIDLTLQDACGTAFEAFGRVHAKNLPTPEFSAPEFNWWGKLAEADMDGVSFGLVQALKADSHVQRELEQHNNTPEFLIPLDRDIILIVARPQAFDHAPNLDDFGAFYVEQGSVVELYPGIWHKAPMTLGSVANTLVIYQKGTAERDKVELDMAQQGLNIRLAGL